MLSTMKIYSLYDFGCCCFSLMYKVEVMIKYCAINYSNLLVKVLTSAVILILWCIIENNSLREIYLDGKSWGYFPRIGVFLFLLRTQITTTIYVPR